MTDAERARWTEIIDSLRGSCASVTDKLNEGEEDLELNSEFCDLLDSELFLCDDCGWWAEVGEGDGDKCEDCFDDEED